MDRRLSILGLTVIGALSLVGCGTQSKLESVNSSAQLAAKKNYIVSKGQAFGGSLSAVAKAQGDQVVALQDGAGFAVVNTANPGAYKAVAPVVVRDIKVKWLSDSETRAGADGLAFADVGNPPSSGENDPLFDLQWGHDAVNAVEAWNKGVRGKGVRVAVLDSGIDRTHPDIAPNLNQALSASFVPGEPYYVHAGSYFNHGTHVAGTIAGADNGVGIIGVAPEAEIMAVKVLSEYSGSGDFSWMINGIIYAANNDADIINMSLGALLPKSGFCDTDGCVSTKDIADLLTAISHATIYATQKGTTVIASAGNDAVDFDHTGNWIAIPSMSAKVVSISATAPIGWAKNPGNVFLDNLSSYSNYGQSAIQFAAPGGDFIYPGNENCTVAGITRACWVFDMVLSASPGGWRWAAGTSMAAPHASGIAALIVGQNGGSMKPAQLISELAKRSSDLGKPGNDYAYGAGRVSSGY